jgi:hypothetical protein
LEGYWHDHLSVDSDYNPSLRVFTISLLAGSRWPVHFPTPIRKFRADEKPCRFWLFRQRGFQWCRSAFVMGVATERAQAADPQGTRSRIRFQMGWPAAGLQVQLPPLTRTGAESPLEAGIEKPQLVESAVFRHPDDFGVRIPQQGDRF